MDTYAAEYDALEKKLEEADKASSSDDEEVPKITAEEQGQFRPGTPVCRAPCSRHSTRERLVRVSSSGNNCWAYCMQLASAMHGSVSHHAANQIRKHLKLPVGTRLSLIEVLLVAREFFKWSGMVTVGANADLPQTYHVWPDDLKAGKVVILRVKNGHCSLFWEQQSAIGLNEAKTWLALKCYSRSI